MQGINEGTLKEIVESTLSAIEDGKRQLFDIAESTRDEYQRVKDELNDVREKLKETIVQVDEMVLADKKARIRLAEVSKHFNSQTEQNIKKAYEDAQAKQLKLTDLKGTEQLLRYKRDHLEMSLRRLEGVLKKSESLASNLAVVTNFLNGEINSITHRMGELEKLQHLGLSIIKAQEEERRRVAREIHDGPAQLMANIVMRAEFCLKLFEVDHSKVKAELVSLQQIVRQSLQDVRKIIFDLRPMVLDDLGLVPAIRRYLEEYQHQHQISVELSVVGNLGRYSTAIEVALFRLVQECLNNIWKHSMAKRVFIKIELLVNKINFLVRDDGKGFNPEEVMADNRKEGYGLLSMRERVQLLKGELSIKSAPGKGTIVSFFVPLDE